MGQGLGTKHQAKVRCQVRPRCWGRQQMEPSEWSLCKRPSDGHNSPLPRDSTPPSIPLLRTYRLLPHKMGCKPAQSCTKAEHWPCRVSGEAGVTGGWVPSSVVVLEPVLAPIPVLLTRPLRLLP